jgi:hypothetical protein
MSWWRILHKEAILVVVLLGFDRMTHTFPFVSFPFTAIRPFLPFAILLCT